MPLNIGQAKTELSRLIARVEAGEAVEIARDGIPVARLVTIELPLTPGKRFFAARGSLAGRITLADNFEFTDIEIARAARARPEQRHPDRQPELHSPFNIALQWQLE